MKCKQRLWMSNLNCGAVCSVSGSLTGSFCCLWSLLPLLFLPFMGTPVFTHTLFFPHLSYLFFLHSTLWTSSTTIFYFHSLLFLITCFCFSVPAHDSHSGYPCPAHSDSPGCPPYCSSLSSPSPFISSGISAPFSRTLLFCSCLSTVISHNSLPLHSQFALWGHQQRLRSSCLASTWAVSIHLFSPLFLTLTFCFLQSSLVTGTLQGATFFCFSSLFSPCHLSSWSLFGAVTDLLNPWSLSHTY